MGKGSKFSHAVKEKLGYYVYVLIDPRNKKVFYVGKGKGNRVFSHARGALTTSDRRARLSRIRGILKSGQQVIYEIHRHGLRKDVAFEVEASLIDFVRCHPEIDDLLNEVGGHKSKLRGQMSAADVIALYDAKPVDVVEPSLFIILRKRYRHGMSPDEVYEAARGNWVLGRRREQAKYAFVLYNGLIRDVFQITKWVEVIERKHGKKKRRWRFEGTRPAKLKHYLRRQCCAPDARRCAEPDPIRQLPSDWKTRLFRLTLRRGKYEFLFSIHWSSALYSRRSRRRDLPTSVLLSSREAEKRNPYATGWYAGEEGNSMALQLRHERRMLWRSDSLPQNVQHLRQVASQ